MSLTSTRSLLYMLTACLLIALFATTCRPAGELTTNKIGGPSQSEAEAPVRSTPAPSAPSHRSLGSPQNSDELIGYGELGLLPAIYRTLSGTSGCSPEDPYSTCQ